MHGAEYDELVEALTPYLDKMTIIVSEPLLGEVGADAVTLNDDKLTVAKAVVAAACADAGYADAAAAAADGAAIVLMGHGTEHEANISYEQMQSAMELLGYVNVFVGTVEGLPVSTEYSNVISAVKAAGYKKVFLRPLMVVAGDHANNDMADPEDPESWLSLFLADGSFGTDVTPQIAGLGEIKEVQDLYVTHVQDAMDSELIFAYEGSAVNFIDAVGAGFGMWTAQDGTTAFLDGDNVVIHYVPKNTTTYGGFVFGSITRKELYDGNSVPAVDVAANDDGTLDFIVSKKNCGLALPIAVVKKKFGTGKTSTVETWTSAEQYYLAIPTVENLYKNIDFTIKAGDNTITAADCEMIENGYDASYNWGVEIKSIVPLFIVKLPYGTKEVNITLNKYANLYQTYFYTREPGEDGYSDPFPDDSVYGFGDGENGWYYASPDKEYTCRVETGNAVVRVQTAYDENWISYNLYAIAFEYLPQPQTIKASYAKQSVDYAALAKKKQTFDPITVTGAKTKLSYTFASGDKCISVDKKTGKVSIAKGTDAGSYSAKIKVNAAATEEYEAATTTVTVKITVKQSAQPMVVKATKKTQTVKYNKTKNQTIKNAVKVTKNQGTLTYKISNTKYFSINKKGVITVKAGTPKKSYKVTVTVTAKGNKNYKKGSAKATFTIKVTK
jgi:cobalamin biosynthesis Co2+ chelatase CbiK